MADAPATPATGQNSTPTEPAATAPSTPAAAAPAETTTTPSAPTTSSTPTAAPSVSTETQTEPTAKPAETKTEAPKDAPLFTIPDTVKIRPETVSAQETFIRSKLGADGKLSMTGQELTDHLLGLFANANEGWKKQITDTDNANKVTCQQRFTPVQLGMAETAIGFFTSFDPEAREWAQRQLNDPTFVNVMRLVGERLSEDTLEVAGGRPVPVPKTAAQKLYGPKSN